MQVGIDQMGWGCCHQYSSCNKVVCELKGIVLLLSIARSYVSCGIYTSGLVRAYCQCLHLELAVNILNKAYL